MSVLIKGMKMPKCCIDCEFMSWSNIRQRDICDKTGEAIRTAEHWEKRDILCPLVEIPTPHGRLIDADELREKMIKEADTYIPYVQERERHGYHNCELLVDDAPTVIEREE